MMWIVGIACGSFVVRQTKQIPSNWTDAIVWLKSYSTHLQRALIVRDMLWPIKFRHCLRVAQWYRYNNTVSVIVMVHHAHRLMWFPLLWSHVANPWTLQRSRHLTLIIQSDELELYMRSKKIEWNLTLNKKKKWACKLHFVQVHELMLKKAAERNMKENCIPAGFKSNSVFMIAWCGCITSVFNTSSLQSHHMNDRTMIYASFWTMKCFILYTQQAILRAFNLIC